ncbi:unnamed protein product, partial [marine sediment metagenome]
SRADALETFVTLEQHNDDMGLVRGWLERADDKLDRLIERGR